MEIDSGATMSIMSQKMYKKWFSRFKLCSSEVVLKDYSGKVISVIGEMGVTVKCWDQVLKSVLLVSEGNGPTLMGINWIRYLSLDWSQVNHVACPVEQLCDKYSEVFSDKLGLERWRRVSGSLLQQLSLTFELFPLLQFFLYFLTILFYFSLELSVWAIWRLASLILVFILLFSIFSAVSGETVRSPIVYSRDRLLALSSAAVPPHKRLDVPRELRRRRRGCSPGAVRRRRRTCYRPVLPSIIMGNVRSLPNKMDGADPASEGLP